MKQITILLLVSTLIFVLGSCSNDEDCCINSQVVHYDGENANAPFLPQGLYEFTARYPSSLLADVSKSSLVSVDVYIYELPASPMLHIYEDVRGDIGTRLHSQSISDLRANAWNKILLSSPVQNVKNGLWVGIEVVHDSETQTVGCDSGPAAPNGDWLYDEVDKQYIKYESRVGTSINWNIRAVFL